MQDKKKTGYINERIDRLRKSIKKEQVDIIAIFSDENRKYLSGFTGEDGNYDESAGVLLISQEDLILATDSRYKLQALNESPLYSLYCYEKGLSREIPEIVKSMKIASSGGDIIRIAVETSRITFDLYSRIRGSLEQSIDKIGLTPADEVLKNFRIIKDSMEIDAIRASLMIAETAFLKLRDLIRPGLTEKEAAWMLEKLMREGGADSLSFPTIVASGENSALPHAVPGDRQFRKNEPLLFDFGAKLDGYCSDISRTVIIGEPDSTFKEAYSTLFDAQAKAIDAVKPGIKCSEVDRIAREHIDASRFKGTFGHALGHGVGIAIHEPPRVSRLDETELQAGMVITVEPGIYITGWGGIRLENMVTVTADGAEVINSTGLKDYIL